jgi:hypothetical protein
VSLIGKLIISMDLRKDSTFRVKLGGRDDFKSVERALLRLCSCKTALDETVDKGELFGTDLDGI